MNKEEFNYTIKLNCVQNARKEKFDDHLVIKLRQLLVKDCELFNNSLRIARLENDLQILTKNPKL